MDLPDLPSLPNFPDAVTGAIIAGAFALVGQSLVKVWEVRQRRRDDLTNIYAERFAAVQVFSAAVHALAAHRGRVEYLRDALSPEGFMSAPDYLKGWNEEEREEVIARVAQRRRELSAAPSHAQSLERAVQSARDSLGRSDVKWRLYAKAPLLKANESLEDELRQVQDDHSIFATPTRADRWLRRARWELNASGSVGFALVLHSLFVLLFYLKTLGTWVIVAIITTLGILAELLLSPVWWVMDMIDERRYPDDDDDQGPSGAGRHGTDIEPTSATEGEDHAQFHKYEPGSPPGDR